MKKTFKIGEVCVGGIVHIETNKNKWGENFEFKVSFVDWFTSEILTTYSVNDFDELTILLEENSTHYWADRIANYFRKTLK
jgi:hypothetical protein